MKMGVLWVKMDGGDKRCFEHVEGVKCGQWGWRDGFCTWMVVIYDNLPFDSSKMNQKPRIYCQSG